ncbi:MAG: T9SS type A sorting domain-containing protein [Bacteroidetes bacterium]|nr:MAG: T9SS type A sorting domain-containing protein [Bacteroidota bacterium]
MRKYLLFCLVIAVIGLALPDRSQAQQSSAAVADTTKYRTFRPEHYRGLAAYVTKSGFTKRGLRPTAGNVRDSVFMNHGFGWETPGDGGFLRVGHRFTDSSLYYGWFFYLRWNYRAPEVRYYIFSRSALKKPANYLTFRGEIKTTTYFGNAGNSLTQHVTALKTNIAASDLGITPPGLGDLVFNQASGPETILNGKTIREIVMLADSAMTLGYRQRTRYPISLINILNTVTSRINGEFYSPTVDTVSTAPLILQGVKTVASVSYLYFDSTKLSPWNRHRSTVRMNKETAMTILGYKLEQNYPNPFNPTTNITYQLPSDSRVRLAIYDVSGREVALLADEVQSMGEQYIEWNAAGFASGVYFYRLEATSVSQPGAAFVQHKKMLLLK